MSYVMVKTIPRPCMTVSGKTVGPAVMLGRSRIPVGGGVYLHETELRGALRAFGWPAPETHEKTLAELEQARVDLAAAATERERLQGENETLRAAILALKPTASKRPKAD